MADLEDSLKKLDRLTQEEARMALSEVLKITHNTRDEVKLVDGKVEIVGDKVEGVGDKVDDVGDKVDDVGDKVVDVGDKVDNIGDQVDDVGDKVDDVGDKVDNVGDKVKNVGDKVQNVGDEVQNVRDKVDDVGYKVHVVGDRLHDVGEKVVDVGDKVEDLGEKVEDLGDNVHRVDEKVQVVIDRARGLSPHSLIPSEIYTFRRKASKRRGKGNQIACTTSGKQRRRSQVFVIPKRYCYSRLNLTGNQLKQLLRAWLDPSDPSTNHNIAQKVQQKGTAVWLFNGSILIEWKSSTGSLLWIHGKRTLCQHHPSSRILIDSNHLSGLWEECYLVCSTFPPSSQNSFCFSSSVIQHIMAVTESGSSVIAYFYFDFRALNKQTCHDLLRSLVFQLSTSSSPCCDILHHVYKTHKDGTQQPSDDTLKACLEEMLRLLAQGQIFIILDALDECPDSSGIPSPRDEVLQLVKELVDLRLHGLYICATSRPEVDIRAVLKPLAFRSVSLHDESGQKTDIADYIRNVVNLSPSAAMRRWRAEDRNLVIETLTERADGM